MVSIVLVTYNRARRLRQSIRDILNQTFTDFELIICDDCSPDETQEVCEQFAATDSRIRYYRHASNLRMPENLNFGIRHARYEYIAILHDGDRFKRDLIEQWYNAISQNPNVGFVFNTSGTTDENNNVVETFRLYDEGVVDRKELLLNGFFKQRHFFSMVYGETMVRRSLVERYGYLHDTYGFYADVDLWMDILHTHDAYYCEDMLFTGPAKSIMPQQFDKDLVQVFMYLYRMHEKQRRRAFRSDRMQQQKEMLRFRILSCYYLAYYLLLTIKNFPLKRFLEGAGRVKAYPLLLTTWIGSALLYPVLKPVLVLFDWSKLLISGLQSAKKSTWKALEANR